MQSAATRRARARTAEIAASRLGPYAMTPGMDSMSAHQRPSSSCPQDDGDRFGRDSVHPVLRPLPILYPRGSFGPASKSHKDVMFAVSDFGSLAPRLLFHCQSFPSGAFTDPVLPYAQRHHGAQCDIGLFQEPWRASRIFARTAARIFTSASRSRFWPSGINTAVFIYSVNLHWPNRVPERIGTWLRSSPACSNVASTFYAGPRKETPSSAAGLKPQESMPTPLGCCRWCMV